MVAGIAGREHFASILSKYVPCSWDTTFRKLMLSAQISSLSLLSILSYWTAFFVVILAEEHFIFRRAGGRLGGYDLDGYNNWEYLPPGCVPISNLLHLPL